MIDLIKIASSACLLACTGFALAAQDGVGGRWNLTGTGQHSDHIYWLELTDGGGKLRGRFLNRGASPVDLQDVTLEKGELRFRPGGPSDSQPPEFRARLENGRLIGRTIQDGETVNWIGVRPPAWPAADANAAHVFGTPVPLFDGTSLDNWQVQHKDRPSGWTVADGYMTNEPKANNLISRDKFRNFRIDAEYKLEKGSNSGIYLRGRYELQILDDHGGPPEAHGHMAVYAWTPPRVNASRPPGEWQIMQATLVENRVTVTLNGQKVHDNTVIEAITGGALDADEAGSGPIMVQGDHGRVWMRKLIVTPITSPGEPR